MWIFEPASPRPYVVYQKKADLLKAVFEQAFKEDVDEIIITMSHVVGGDWVKLENTIRTAIKYCIYVPKPDQQKEQKNKLSCHQAMGTHADCHATNKEDWDEWDKFLEYAYIRLRDVEALRDVFKRIPKR